MRKREGPERSFDRLLAQIGDSDFIPDALFVGGGRQPETMNEFLGQFVGSREPMPAKAREALGRIYGERLGVALSAAQLDTYAKAARRLRELRRGESRLRASGERRR
jgi:hypothetical protein